MKMMSKNLESSNISSTSFSVELHMILQALDSEMKELYYLFHSVKQGLLILMKRVLSHSFVSPLPQIFINDLLHIVHLTSHGRGGGGAGREERKIETAKFRDSSIPGDKCYDVQECRGEIGGPIT